MPKVKVIQRYRATRTIVIDVPDQPDNESALEAVSSGSEDLPEWSDERWKEAWELVDEDCESVDEKGETT
jgi:hypothetical protein